MEKVRELIRSKPRVFIYCTVAYLLLISVAKWVRHPSLDALWFFVGGAIGIYFMDAAELFFALKPSPFRSIVFLALFSVVAFFVVTSSTGTIGSGLVLSLFLQMLLWQAGEYRVSGNLDSWYRLVSGQVPVMTQRLWFGVSVCVFLVVSILFLR